MNYNYYIKEGNIKGHVKQTNLATQKNYKSAIGKLSM